MQVSLYLNEALVKKVDELAKRDSRSRSKMVEILLNRALTVGKRATRSR